MVKTKPLGIVLAGGRSRRFGHDKALTQLPDQPRSNAVLAVQKLLPLTATVFVAANLTNAAALRQLFAAEQRVHICVDQPPFRDCGPLGGLFAVTAQQPQQHDYLLLATDYPYLTGTLLRQLAQRPQCFLATATQAHYTLAHFTTTQVAVRQFLTSGQRRLQTFIVAVAGCQPLLVAPTTALTNLNQLK
ncbi:NTP transferase domain-containing protein [Loigolactobacillus binensis]|uniref:NTP transferase domain-containing protein n=1 Tax=Loigolactobacillus binensis TaxID=2559922 RepID=A0ABW3EB35_9LACO|nr:NTP transferase domain-containing protein [Loigolactobacillus binensis]